MDSSRPDRNPSIFPLLRPDCLQFFLIVMAKFSNNLRGFDVVFSKSHYCLCPRLSIWYKKEPVTHPYMYSLDSLALTISQIVEKRKEKD